MVVQKDEVVRPGRQMLQEVVHSPEFDLDNLVQEDTRRLEPRVEMESRHPNYLDLLVDCYPSEEAGTARTS
jgi:hypothetical protein